MYSMKNLLLIVCLLIASGAVSQAQGPGDYTSVFCFSGVNCLGPELIERLVPRVARRADGRLEIWKASYDTSSGTQNATQHFYQTSQYGGFSLETWWGGGTGLRSTPTVVVNSSGLLEMYGEFYQPSINRLVRSVETAPLAYSNSFIADDTMGGMFSEPSAIVNADGRIQLFATGDYPTNYDLHVFTSVQTSVNGSFGSWVSLGGSPMSDESYGFIHPQVVANADGRLELFIWGSDKAIWHAAQTCPGCGFGSFVSLGGTLESDPSVVKSSDGRLAVFARGTDRAIWYTQQQAAGSSTWTTWQSLGGTMYNNPAAIVNTDGTTEIFAIGGDTQLYHIRQISPGQWFSGAWGGMGGSVKDYPVPIMNSDGRVEVFVNGANDGQVYHIMQQTPAARYWGAWYLYSSSAVTIASPAPSPSPTPAPTPQPTPTPIPRCTGGNCLPQG